MKAVSVFIFAVLETRPLSAKYQFVYLFFLFSLSPIIAKFLLPVLKKPALWLAITRVATITKEWHDCHSQNEADYERKEKKRVHANITICEALLNLGHLYLNWKLLHLNVYKSSNHYWFRTGCWIRYKKMYYNLIEVALTRVPFLSLNRGLLFSVGGLYLSRLSWSTSWCKAKILVGYNLSIFRACHMQFLCLSCLCLNTRYCKSSHL